MELRGFERHDHGDCIREGIAEVEGYCARRKLKLTPLRRRVLEILLARHRAMGAYEILDVLRDEGHGAQPPVAYRALDFLVGHGFAHKIQRLNAFAACAHPGRHHTPAFLICRNCDALAEAQADPAQGFLGAAAREAGFVIEQAVVEALGLCPRCRAGAAA